MEIAPGKRLPRAGEPASHPARPMTAKMRTPRQLKKTTKNLR
jgi:hypothetical protein